MTESIIDRALAWAEARLGDPSYAGRCLGFVEDCFERGNSIEVFGYSSAQEAADAYGAQPGGQPAPRGALVFYACQGLVGGDLRRWGHVGIALGDGRVLHAWDVVRVDHERAIEQLAPPPTWTSPAYIGWVPAERLLAGCVPRQWDAP
ncbi:NlpC/P60 family protein [Chloroflexia bacterium SDU3-3]|nr:NlpC/P60 family protein [Chloroflexia bacterium SDU3-3]